MNIKCPSCNFENVEGSDRCEQCLHSLMQRDIPRPKTEDSFQNLMLTAPVGALLTGKDLLVASPSDSVQKIIKILQKENKDCVLIYVRKKLVGILSNRDLVLRVAGKHPDLSKLKVEAVMTANPESVKAEDPIAYVINKMGMGGYRHVPVLRQDGTPLSIVSIQDVFRYISRLKNS
jgi:CBS domain-containing protein